MAYTIRLLYDTPGWAYYWRCLALQKHAPSDFNISVGSDYGNALKQKPHDLILQNAFSGSRITGMTFSGSAIPNLGGNTQATNIFGGTRQGTATYSATATNTNRLPLNFISGNPPFPNSGPTVTSINPNTGSVTGGQPVTITGTGFTGATSVTIQGNGSSFTVVSDTSITATTPPGTAGTDSVNVTTQAGTSAANTLYTYTSSPIPPVVPCFNKGTKILCFNKETREEEYKSVESLKKGDLVKSYKHGYRKIDCIGKGTFTNGNSHPNFNMYKMKQSETNGLNEDLLVTGGHGILMDSMPGESD
jgi:hypothetical protein